MYSSIYDGMADAPKGAVLVYLRFIAPLVLQFSLGALLSASLLFYWFAGSFSVSWPIMLLLVFLMASNEVFRHFFLRPSVQIGVYSFVLFSYFTLLFPFVFHSLSSLVFVIGGVISTVIVLLLIYVLVRFSPLLRKERARMLGANLAVFSVFNALYFMNVIPPIPLSIREAGVYHEVLKVGNEYVRVGEEESLLDMLWPGQTLHGDADGQIYAYTAIFAPTDLTTTIYYRWQHYDVTKKKWLNLERLKHQIRGGRAEGYRGYAFRTGLTTGKWRVIIETERGQVLGRIPFTYEQ